jgi:hypothetical protein
MLTTIKKLLGITPKKENIWKDVKCEYLREYMDFGTCPQDITHFKVYAITQICLVTGKKRIQERYSLWKMEEYDRDHHAYMEQEARNTNNYNHL